MEELKDTKKVLRLELSKITRKDGLSAAELEAVSKIVCILGEIVDIEKDEMEMMDDSFNERSYASRPMRRSYYYPEDGYASARYPRRMSYDMGYSGHSSKEHMIKRLELMLDEAPSEQERMIISECIEKLER